MSTPTTPQSRRPTPLEPLIESLESAESLDGPGKLIGEKLRSLLPPGPFKDAISGTWLGHALHPLLTDVVIGSWTSASLLDLLGGDDDGRASERLISIGIAAYGPTALTGSSDWADSELGDETVRRAGLVHAATNAGALMLYAASLAARRGGRRGRGVALALGGLGALSAGGYLGAHLSYAKGVGADQTIFDPGPADWVQAAEASSLSDGEPTRVVVEETPVLLLRSGGRLFAIHDRCSHRGCSLSDGEVDGETVVCVCHGSRFALSDGAIERGPATAPQPAYEVRERDERIEIRLATT